MESSRHILYAIAETAYGITPATPAFKTIRDTGVTMALTKGTMLSAEMRSDRQIVDQRHGNRQVGGDVVGELLFGTYDDFLEAVLGGTWAAKYAPYTASTLSAAAADNSINDSATALPLFTVGDKVTISGFSGSGTTANQSGVVISSTTAKLVLSTAIAIVNDAAGEAVTVTTNVDQLKAGTVRRSFSLLRNFTDEIIMNDHPFHIFTGIEFDKLALKTTVEALIEATFSIMGQNQGAPLDTAPASSTYIVANTNKPYDSILGTLTEGGSAIAVVTELSLALDNGFAPRFVVNSNLTRRPSIGRSNANGQVTIYAENSAMLEKFLNETESSIVSLLKDPAGNKMRLTLPRIKYNGGQMDTKGEGPITSAMPFQALLDSVSGTNLMIERIAV